MQAFLFVLLVPTFIAVMGRLCYCVLKQDPEMQFYWGVLKGEITPEDIDRVFKEIEEEDKQNSFEPVGRIGSIGVYQIEK